MSTMIGTKLTALLVALGLLGVAGLGAPLAFQNAVAQVTLENEAEATNEDNDFVAQSNWASVEQKSKIKCEAEAEAESENEDSVQFGDNTNTAIAANDCDNTQTATVGQANVNTDNDVQVASAEACQTILASIGPFADIC